MAERMKTETDLETKARVPLSRERILATAVAFADREGADSLSMRRLAQELDVVPMALYKHLANKDEMLDGMLDVVVGEIDPARTDTDWKTAVRDRILSARRALLRHPWASRVMESRTQPTPVVMAYMDSMIGMFTAGGFSIDLTHHVMHAMGSRLMGFSQELFNDQSDPDAPMQPEMIEAMAATYPVDLRAVPGGQPRRRVGRRPRLRRPVRVRVLPRPDARRHRTPQGRRAAVRTAAQPVQECWFHLGIRQPTSCASRPNMIEVSPTGPWPRTIRPDVGAPVAPKSFIKAVAAAFGFGVSSQHSSSGSRS